MDADVVGCACFGTRILGAFIYTVSIDIFEITDKNSGLAFRINPEKMHTNKSRNYFCETIEYQYGEFPQLAA
jgi:hypothetical protein